MKKRIFALALIGVMAFAACTPAAEDSSSASSGSASSETSSVSESSAESETAEASSESSESSSAASGDTLEKLDVSQYTESPVVANYIPEDCDLTPTKEDGTPYKIAWLNPDMSDESMAFMNECMVEIAGEMGVELVQFDAQSDPQKQSDHINNAISQQCDAIIINPIDPSASVTSLQKAKDAGLVVVNAQNIVNDTSVIDTYIGPNDVLAGQLAASMIMDQFPDGAKIVEIGGFAGATAQVNRSAGFNSTIAGDSKYELLEEQASTSWGGAEAMAVMESFLSKYDDIDAVFCHWDMGTLSCIQAAEAVGRADDIMFVSVDGQQAALDKIMEEGSSFYGTVFQDFYTNSLMPLYAAVAILNGDGDKIELENYPEYVCITADNAGNFEAGW